MTLLQCPIQFVTHCHWYIQCHLVVDSDNVVKPKNDLSIEFIHVQENERRGISWPAEWLWAFQECLLHVVQSNLVFKLFLCPAAICHSEVPLSTDQHLQVVNKLCASFEELNPPEVPPLVHQLLQLCKDEHGTALFLRLQSYFCTRLYNRLLSNASESENAKLAAFTDSIGLGKY